MSCKVFLKCERPSFALLKVVFCVPVWHLSQPERASFVLLFVIA